MAMIRAEYPALDAITAARVELRIRRAYAGAQILKRPVRQRELEILLMPRRPLTARKLGVALGVSRTTAWRVLQRM